MVIYLSVHKSYPTIICKELRNVHRVKLGLLLELHIFLIVLEVHGSSSVSDFSLFISHLVFAVRTLPREVMKHK